MSVLLHAVPLAGVCRKERSSPVPQVRARPEEMRCVGSKRTPEMGQPGGGALTRYQSSYL